MIETGIDETKIDDAQLDRAIDVWGDLAQIDMGIEESSELITALAHAKRGRGNDAAVCDEIADVVIISHQLAIMFGESAVGDAIAVKMERLESRLDDAEARREDD